jgi:hypothetical protein
MFYAIISSAKLRNYIYQTAHTRAGIHGMKGMSIIAFVWAFFDTKYDEDEIIKDYKNNITSWIKIAVIFFLVYLFTPLFFSDPTSIG